MALSDQPAQRHREIGRVDAVEEVIRSSGQCGPRVPVKDDADAQTKLLGFIGRDPQWLAFRD